MFDLNKIYNMDCLEGMKQIPDKYFDLAIVDPPYFEGPNKRKYYGNEVNKLNIKRKQYPVISNWLVPDESYFNELIRVSKNQIVWGINYFDVYLGPGRIVWDKVNGKSSFSDAEIAYCSSIKSVRIFRYMWNGMMQGKSIEEGHIVNGNKKTNENRIHPTQKPIALYEWLLKNYTQPGYKILDTHVGSASSLIACYNLGFDFIGFELDILYYNLASKRLEQRKSQMDIFHIGDAKDFVEYGDSNGTT